VTQTVTDEGRSVISTPTVTDALINVVTTPVRSVSTRDDELGLAIAVAAHELRAPLLAARAVVERLLYAPATSDERDALLSESLAELERLAETTDLLLRWARGSVPLEVGSVDLVEIVDAAVREAERSAPGRSVSFVAPARLPIEGDGAYLRIAIVNLVRNALAYSPKPSTIEVVVVADGDDVIVRVADHGPGIALDDRPALFQPFAQGRLGRARGSGAGLGLFIARRIVEAHGGSIAAESGTHGTVFRIAVPATRTAVGE